MKRIITILLSVCFTLCLGFSLTACDDGSPDDGGGVTREPCVHTWEVSNMPAYDSEGTYRCPKCYLEYPLPMLDSDDYTKVAGENETQHYTYNQNGHKIEFTASNFIFDGGERSNIIIGYRGNSEHVIIPSVYNGVTIKEVDTIAGGFKNCTFIKSIEVPSTVTLSSGTLEGCTNIEKITVPSTVYSITSLFSEKVPDSLKTVVFNGGESITNSALYACDGIENLTIPKSVTSIGQFAFRECNGLKNVYYEGTVKDWCNISFSAWDSNPISNPQAKFFIKDETEQWIELTTLEIPNGVTEISKYQFHGFDIEKLIISDEVVAIGEDAFYDCSELHTIMLGSGVNSIASAFGECEKLKEIWYKSTESNYGKISINNSSNNYYFKEAAKYYYAEEFSVFDYADGDIAWHYNDNNEPELWSFNITNTVDGKRYRYDSTELIVTDEYWYMLQQAEAQGMLEYVLDADTLAIYKNSETAADFQAGMLALTQNIHAGIEIVFEDGMIKAYQNGQQATYPLQYIEVNGSEIYYKNNETLAYTIKDGKIVEDLSDEYGTVIHTYIPVSE